MPCDHRKSRKYTVSVYVLEAYEPDFDRYDRDPLDRIIEAKVGG
jgi:hypothetical protein